MTVNGTHLRNYVGPIVCSLRFYWPSPFEPLYSVKRRFVWVYASVQFALVVLFAHIFYSLVRAFLLLIFSLLAYLLGTTIELIDPRNLGWWFGNYLWSTDTSFRASYLCRTWDTPEKLLHACPSHVLLKKINCGTWEQEESNYPITKQIEHPCSNSNSEFGN